MILETSLPMIRRSEDNKKVLGWMPPTPLQARIIIKENGTSILPAINRLKSLYSGRHGSYFTEFLPTLRKSSPESPLMAAAIELTEILTSPIEFHGMKSNFSLYAPAEYRSESSISHLDLQYKNTPDFLMLPDATFMMGATLDEMIAVKTRNGTLSPLCIYGPRTLDLLGTIGWQVYNSDGTSFSPAEPHRIEFHDDDDFKESVTKVADSPKDDAHSDSKSDAHKCTSWISAASATIISIGITFVSLT
jgi:hypothetical protein